jgi:ribosomal protein L11 methyltransferase
MAFGTGTHPTTQLSLQLLETYLKPNEPVLDIGCGSGILSIGAIKLGASMAYGVDIEAASVENAQENAAKNEVQDETVFEKGSVVEVKADLFPIQQAPVVVANILTHILIRLFEDGMADLVQPGGILLLSGILDEKEPEILSALEANQMVVIERLQMEDWVGLAAKKS